MDVSRWFLKTFLGFLFSYYFFTQFFTNSRNPLYSTYILPVVNFFLVLYITTHTVPLTGCWRTQGKIHWQYTSLWIYFLTIIACCQLVFWSSKLSMKASQNRFYKVISWNKSKLVFHSIYKPGSKKMKPLAYMQKIPIFDFFGYKKNRMFNWVQRFWLICST